MAYVSLMKIYFKDLLLTSFAVISQQSALVKFLNELKYLTKGSKYYLVPTGRYANCDMFWKA